MTDNTMREAFENCSLHDDYVEVKSLEENRKWFSAGWQAAQMECKHSESVPVVGEPECYDAGLLNDFGGGNVGWWQDYIRSELARAHDFYVSQWPSSSPATELERLRKDAERWRVVKQYGYAMEEAIDAAIAQDRGE